MAIMKRSQVALVLFCCFVLPHTSKQIVILLKNSWFFVSILPADTHKPFNLFLLFGNPGGITKPRCSPPTGKRSTLPVKTISTHLNQVSFRSEREALLVTELAVVWIKPGYSPLTHKIHNLEVTSCIGDWLEPGYDRKACQFGTIPF